MEQNMIKHNQKLIIKIPIRNLTGIFYRDMNIVS